MAGRNPRRADPMPFVDVLRRADGTADWRRNFDLVAAEYNRSRLYVARRLSCDCVLIGFLIRLRHTAKRERRWDLADAIRRVLAVAEVEIEDRPGVTHWRIKYTADGGDIPVDEEEAGTHT